MLTSALVCGLLSCTALIGSPLEHSITDWDAKKPGARVGSVSASEGAEGSDPIISTNGPGGAHCASFDFDLGSEPRARVIQAESAKLKGCVVYGDRYASGKRGVGGFGESVGDSIAFENVPTSDGLRVFYNNGTGSAKQCSLYVDDKDVATLRFEDTGGWFTPFRELVYTGEISKQFRLQIDSDDFAANGDFCCNVDKIVLGASRAEPEVIAHLNADPRTAPEDSAFLSFAVRTCKGVAYSLALEDQSGAAYVTPGITHDRNNDWEHQTIWLPDLRPSWQPATTRRVVVRISGDTGPTEGTFDVGSVVLSATWPSRPPADCPFEPSGDFAAVRFTGRHREYTTADTWYPSWASDGSMYSPYTDGTVEGTFSDSNRPEATTGMAKIEGDDPLDLKVSTLGLHTSRPWPYTARYPCGGLVHNGIWYYGTYIINTDDLPDGLNTYQGPFVGFRYSKDYGKTWTETPCTPLNNLFGEAVDKVPGGYSKIKMSSPHFVDFGQNMEHSPDGKAYLVAHGCTRPSSMNTWIRGDQVYLARVTPTPENINDVKKYEFYAGRDRAGKPVWSRRFRDIKPVFEWNGRAGCVTATYVAPLRKYLMCVSTGETVSSAFDTYVLESDELTGPWRLVTYMERFGRQAYFVNVPSKFVSKDGLSMWLCFAANWTGHDANLPGAGYAMCLQEMELVRRK